VEIARGELVEKELNVLIARRHDRRVADEGERPALEKWQESERRYDERRREENRLAWCDYFSRLAGSLRARAEEYDQRAALLTNTEEKAS
jgi:hypothetical protein